LRQPLPANLIALGAERRIEDVVARKATRAAFAATADGAAAGFMLFDIVAARANDQMLERHLGSLISKNILRRTRRF
jgi:hypothetical protein